ncbi:conserved hypothetical protein [Ricinus communis]|uniref:Uncharacterized protein n=1 Tax=Ricinus communis TaxID=3988 RepID=B9SRB1_RICCO|nr:conserved hypothetical protein [Ricinus communis]
MRIRRLVLVNTKALFGTNKRTLNDGTITPRATRHTDTGAEANTASIRIIEGLCSLLRFKFHSLVGLEMRVSLRNAEPSGILKEVVL